MTLLSTVQSDLATAQAALTTLSTDLTAYVASLAAPTGPSGTTGPAAPPPSTVTLVPTSLAGTDATAAIQTLINAAAAKATSAAPWTVEVPAAASPYHINPTYHGEYGLELASNVTLQIDSGATLDCVTTLASLQTYYQLYFPAGVSNAHLTGAGRIVGDRSTKSNPSEWGMGVGVDACSNCGISGTLTVTGCCGDGLYLGPGTAHPVNFNVAQGFTSTANRRNGLTIDCLNGGTIGGSYTNNSGTLPACGVDIEPMSGQNVTGLILKAIVTGNAGGGIQSGPDDANDTGTFTNSTLSGCTVNNNGTSGGSYLGTATFGIKNQNSSGITISANSINGTFGPAVQVRNKGTNISVISNSGTGNTSGVVNSIGSGCTTTGNSFS